MDADSLDTCKICMDLFNNEIRPRTLKCGHSFCTKCLGNFIKNGSLMCPICQQADKANSPLEFPINFSMEEVIASLRQSHANNMQSLQTVNNAQLLDQRSVHEPRSLPPGSIDISSKMRSLIHQHKESTLKLTQETVGIQSDLCEYKCFLDERQAQHESLTLQIMALLNNNKGIVRQLEHERKRVTDAILEGKSKEQKASDRLERLDAVAVTREAALIIEDLDKFYSDLEEWNIVTQKHMPDVKAVASSEKVLKEITKALSPIICNSAETSKAARDGTDLTISPLPILAKLNRARGRPTISLQSLENMPNSVKSLLEKGHLYAVQQKDDKVRSAKLTIENCKVYLHCLQDRQPPEYAHTIEHESLIKSLDKDSVVAFMDLSWGAKELCGGRIHIHLNPYTPLATNFRSLCTGDFGPSYAKSRFFQVSKKGYKYDECIRGGDYEHNDGTGGAPVVKGLNIRDPVYSRKISTGMIWAHHNDTDGPMSAQFSIRTGKGTNYWVVGAFGHLLDGIDIVKEAVNVGDISSVEITQCGILVPS